ncbi:hypothetical protein BGW41_001141 [Actinomortierella wolfii]|nr:hypothetical protein BGW41_001141 [Actinomortierella wolfii]
MWLGVRQLHYNNNQPVPLVDLVQEHGSTMQELHLKQVDLTVDEYVQLAQMLGLAQGEVKLGYQGRGTTKDDDEEDNDEGIRQDRRHHHLRRPRDSRTRLRSITFENCRNALRRSVLEALAEHCGSGLEHLELHGMSRGRPLGWPTVAALEPYPIPTEHSLSVLGSATISMYRKTDLGLSSMLKKCGLTPVQALGQDDQAMLQHWMKNKSLRKEQGNKQAPVAGGDAQAEHHQEYDPTQLEAYINSLDPEARLGEALVELGRLAPRLTSLKISMADGLWDGCLDLFRHPDQADSSDRGPLSPWQPLKRPFLSRSDSAYASSSSMSISPPLSPSPVIGSWTPSSPSISSGSVTPLPPAAEDQNDEDDSSIKTPSKTSVWRGRVNPSRKCSLQELVLIRCGLKSEENPNGSRLTIPGLVKVCGPDLETLVVDRETCWRPDHTDGSLPSECFTATGDQILGGLLASEQQKSTQTKMTSLKHLLLMDHWVSVPMIKRAFDAWSFHLKAVQFLVLPCTLETLLDALSPSCDNPALEVLMLSIVHESDLAALWSLKPEEVRVFLPTVFGRFPQLRVVRLTHSGATWTRTEWEAFCSLESANTTV